MRSAQQRLRYLWGITLIASLAAASALMHAPEDPGPAEPLPKAEPDHSFSAAALDRLNAESERGIRTLGRTEPAPEVPRRAWRKLVRETLLERETEDGRGQGKEPLPEPLEGPWQAED